jgi:carotenoid cleavage dioxygenase-like enzyme
MLIILKILETLSMADYENLNLPSTIAAHPHVDPVDGSWINIGMNKKKMGFDFVKYDGKSLKDPSLKNILENGKLINTVPWSSYTNISYAHSFGVTENYIIFIENSLQLNLFSILSNYVLNKPLISSIKSNPNFNARLHIINKNTGELVKQQFHTDPLIVLHHINAYEKREQV